MTQAEKTKIVDQILELLCQLTTESDTAPTDTMVLLTVKECAEAVKGLSERTVRQLISENKIAHIRIGKGSGSKILVSKDSLFNYLNDK